MQAVICTGGAGPAHIPPIIGLDSPIVICADSGYHLALRLGLQPNWLIGDLDSLDISEHAVVPTCQIVRHPRDKDATDSELALRHARTLGCHPIILLGGGGQRSDHFLALVWLYEGSLYPHIWISDSTITYCITHHWSAADLRIGEIVSVLPVGAPPWRLQSNGLRWELDGVQWQRANSGICNQATGQRAHIKVLQGRVLVMRHLPPLIDSL